MSLRLEGDPILAQVCPDFDFADPVMPPDRLSATLLAIMRQENGLGLAAPQIGVLTRVFAMRSIGVVFNPTIRARVGGEVLDEEGCLSYPGVWVRVRRPRGLHVDYQRWDGSWVLARSLAALIDVRCFCHELDHLDGRTLPDLVPKQAFIAAKARAAHAARKSA